MLIDRLLNEGSTPLLEQTVNFTARRAVVLADDVVNVGTPGFQQKDMDLPAFQQMLAAKAADRATAGPGAVDFSDIREEIETPNHGQLFHDGANRSMEQLEAEQAKNGLMHNVAIELLRQQFQTLQMALKERIS